MTHALIGQFLLTNDQVNKYYFDLSDDDIKAVFKPINCIGWLIGHMALGNYQFLFKNIGNVIPEDAKLYGNGQPHSTPDKNFILNMWEDSADNLKKWIINVSDDDLINNMTGKMKDEKVNLGTDLSRMMFHTWNHLGEIASVRQLLGKDPGNPGYGSWDWRF
jgi:hypothetical protein